MIFTTKFLISIKNTHSSNFDNFIPINYYIGQPLCLQLLVGFHFELNSQKTIIFLAKDHSKNLKTVWIGCTFTGYGVILNTHVGL